MKILDRLPIPDRPHVVSVGSDVVQVHRNQIIVWISINDVSRPLPAILDTGHGHNLSIGEGQLRRWSGGTLKRIGELEVGHQRVVQYAADVRMHRNVPGRAALGGDSLTPISGSEVLNTPTMRGISEGQLKSMSKREASDHRVESADG